MNLSDYKEEAYRQLNDDLVYESVLIDPSCDVASIVSDKLKVWHNAKYIDSTFLEYFKSSRDLNSGKFYLMP